MTTKKWTMWGTIIAGITLLLAVMGFMLEKRIGSISSWYQSGGITAETVNYYETSAMSQSIASNSTLPVPLFSLAREMRDFSGTSVDKEAYFAKNIGLVTPKTEGYVANVISFSDDEALVWLTERLGGSLYDEQIDCYFSEGTTTARALKKESKIRFWGIVDEYRPGIVLRKCRLETLQ